MNSAPIFTDTRTGRKSYYIASRTERSVGRHTASFDVVDEKGRPVGYVFSICEVSVTLISSGEAPRSGSLHSVDKPTTYYIGRSSTTRGGEGYGPISNPVEGNSISEVHDAMIRRQEDARKRATKKFAAK